MTTVHDRRITTIAILGGGFTGAGVAYRLANRLHDRRSRIVVVEPREKLGGGLAYSATDPAFRLNVPAAGLSLVPDEPGFADWLSRSGACENDPEARTPAGHLFPRRAVFGRYVAEQLEPLLASGRVEHVHGAASDVARTPEGFSISVGDRPPLPADIVVLAMTHPAASVPQPLKPLAGLPGFVSDVGDGSALATLPANARVLIVGNGLTACDVIASLDRRRHRGPNTTLSRHGLVSRGHLDRPAAPRGNFLEPPVTGAFDLLRRTRREIAEAQQAGESWHGVIDVLRQQGQEIWARLPLVERVRLVRHLRAFWDVHRFRVAPQVESAMKRLAGEGRLRVMAASLQHAEAERRSFRVTFRRRGRAEIETAAFDAIVVATGPHHSAILESNGPMRSLAGQGLIRLDPTLLGLETTADSRAVAHDGRAVERLYVAGPLARARAGELMGVPNVSRHAQRVADTIADLVNLAVRPDPLDVPLSDDDPPPSGRRDRADSPVRQALREADAGTG